MSVRIEGDAIAELNASMDQFPRAVRYSAQLAINDTARFTRRIGAQKMLAEVDFPRGYFNQPKRFHVSKFATESDLQAVVTGRGRGTSLLRFADGNPTPASTRGRRGQRGGGVNVTVHPGKTQSMPGAFVVRLNSGKGMTDDNFNLGLAVRIKPGHTLKSKYKYDAAQLARGIYVLYGPSVAQAFDLVKQDILPEVTSELGRQFKRQFLLNVKDD